ncbi:MAG TPA: hypothetical protein VGH98_03465 [Gemmatimonadaceae bacterium]
MRRRYSLLFILSSAAASAKLPAQAPMAGVPGPGMAGALGAQMLLAQTGPLQLTDVQVVKLAAIARRAEDRHRAMRTRLDSLRLRRVPGERDSTARPPREGFSTDLFEHEREASHNDLRDALAVLSPDQQARAWEMFAARRVTPFARVPMRDDGARGERRARPPAGRMMPAPTPRRPGESESQ